MVPATIVADALHAGKATLFVLAALALILFVASLAATTHGLRSGPPHETDPDLGGWSLRASLLALALATAATAIVSEIFVHSLEAFADAAGLSEFFIAIVIVAIVGNAAEHGGAVVIARRGKMKLATGVAASSSAQVAVLLVPV